MIYFIGLCIFSVFAVIGAFEMLRHLIKRFYKKIRCFITIHTCEFETELEYTIRSIALNYPDMIIKVIDDGKNPDSAKIINTLSKQYPQLIIGKNEVSV